MNCITYHREEKENSIFTFHLFIICYNDLLNLIHTLCQSVSPSFYKLYTVETNVQLLEKWIGILLVIDLYLIVQIRWPHCDNAFVYTRVWNPYKYHKWWKRMCIIPLITLITAGLVVSIVDPQPGESIIDCCAAPGGKTLFMASRLNGQGNLHINLAHHSWQMKAFRAEITWKNIVLLHILGAN